MQKDILTDSGQNTEEINEQRATSENQTNLSDGNQPKTFEDAETESDNNLQFEELIKGPYKEAFAQKVQGIINKRFKEQKIAMAEEKKVTNDQTDITHTDEAASKIGKVQNEPTFESLIEAGVDPNTAYSVIHLDEIVEKSARQGAEIATKNISENLRLKASRPRESALGSGGYSLKAGVSNLTSDKRKELAKKAMMGEKIGF